MQHILERHVCRVFMSNVGYQALDDLNIHNLNHLMLHPFLDLNPETNIYSIYSNAQVFSKE